MAIFIFEVWMIMIFKFIFIFEALFIFQSYQIIISLAMLSQAPALLVTISRMSSMPEPLPEIRALTNLKHKKLDTEWKQKEKNIERIFDL